MIRYGIVSDVDNKKALVRVQFDDSDGIVSDWIPVIVHRSKGVQFSHAMEVGEHVACLMDQNAENGVCLGCIYDAGNAPAQGDDGKFVFNFGDGTVIQYDAATKFVSINSPAKVEVVVTNDLYLKSDGTLKIEAPETEVAGNLKVTGNANVNGEVKAFAAGPGVKLSTHIHTEPDGTTGAPVPGS